MNSGSPPTPLKARTGEFTPPGNNDWARANSLFPRGSADRQFLEARAGREMEGQRALALLPAGVEIEQVGEGLAQQIPRLGETVTGRRVAGTGQIR